MEARTRAEALSRRLGHRQLDRSLSERQELFCDVRSGDSACLGNLGPNRKCSLARSAAEVGSHGLGIGNVEKVRDLIVNRQKPLCLPGGFVTLSNGERGKPASRAFSSGRNRRAPCAHCCGAESSVALGSCEVALEVEDVVDC